ncbi:zinc phosphodiesterase ELAC protein 2 [Eucyclogobius newberryi]|uniref:zinc phosphodiesterase ELAC protein 2 n=1 Tax=Eucyclogobius newberryi TaxID=166745 RepID=UPI003B591B74
MTAAHSTFRAVSLLLFRDGTPFAHASRQLCPRPRTVVQRFRAMATNNGGNAMKNGNAPKKAKQKEALRRTKAKQNRQMRGDVHGPATVYVQVVGSGSRDNAASLYVFSEFNRYLFNCGEGTQRLMQEHKLKAARLDNIFLTRLSWENVGGLSGMILTLKDTGVPECVLSGPPQLENYLSAIKSFSGPLEEIRLSVRPYTEETHTDETMTVTQVPLFARLKSPRNATQNFSSDKPADAKPSRDPSLVVAFVCKLHPKKGNFLVFEAKELGLPVGTAAIGPLIKALKEGHTVEFEGKEIRPEQVCTPTDPGPVFLVLECPSEDFITAVCSNPHLQRHVSGTDDPAALVVHICPESVLSSEQYQRWMESFPSSTQHLVLNENTITVHNVRSHKLQSQLHMIHPEVFPLLQRLTLQEPQALHVPHVRAECLLKYQLRPVMGWQREMIPGCDEEQFVREASEVPQFLQEVEKSKKLWSKQNSDTDAAAPFPEVVFLGTGSALPMKTRNVSATLLNISPSQSLLLDCGEGTFGQLCRHYGDSVDQALCRISSVFISHMHADHHTGLLKLLYQRERALASLGKDFSPVFLIGPSHMMSWLNQYHEACEDVLRHVNFIPNRSLCADATGTRPRTQSLIQALLKRNGLDKFEACLVRHCKNAFACALTHSSGWKLSFSGDTMPCDALVNIGRDSTLLIHEATLEDALEEEAVEKRHSTTSQAIGIGMKMNARFIVLNHFSQRYAKIPVFSADFSERVGISFDHMKVRFRDLQLLPALTPALKTLFAEDLSEMEEERERRELRNPRTPETVPERGAETAPERGAETAPEQGAETAAPKRGAETSTADAHNKRLKSS